MNENGRGSALHNHREEKKTCGKEGIFSVKLSQATRRHPPMTDYLFSREAERLVEIEGFFVYLADFPLRHINQIFVTCRGSLQISNNV